MQQLPLEVSLGHVREELLKRARMEEDFRDASEEEIVEGFLSGFRDELHEDFHREGVKRVLLKLLKREPIDEEDAENKMKVVALEPEKKTKKETKTPQAKKTKALPSSSKRKKQKQRRRRRRKKRRKRKVAWRRSQRLPQRRSQRLPRRRSQGLPQEEEIVGGRDKEMEKERERERQHTNLVTKRRRETRIPHSSKYNKHNKHSRTYSGRVDLI